MDRRDALKKIAAGGAVAAGASAIISRPAFAMGPSPSPGPTINVLSVNNQADSRFRIRVNLGGATCTGTPTGGPNNITVPGPISLTATSAVVTPGRVVVRNNTQGVQVGQLLSNGSQLTVGANDGDVFAFTKRGAGNAFLPYDGGGVDVQISVTWQCEYTPDPPVSDTFTDSEALRKGPPAPSLNATASDGADRIDQTPSGNRTAAVPESTTSTTTTATTTAPEATTTTTSSTTTTSTTSTTTTTTVAPDVSSTTAAAAESTTSSAAPAIPADGGAGASTTSSTP